MPLRLWRGASSFRPFSLFPSSLSAFRIIPSVTVSTPATPPPDATPQFTLNDLLVYMAKQEASDLHLKPTRPPLIRVRGKLVQIPGVPPLKPADLEKLLLPLLNLPQKAKFDQLRPGDSAYSCPTLCACRPT